jgi:hypothetical protein
MIKIMNKPSFTLAVWMAYCLLFFWSPETCARVIPRQRRTANVNNNGTLVKDVFDSQSVSSSPLLPIWATVDEEAVHQDFMAKGYSGLASQTLNKQVNLLQAAQTPLRIPAEYEPVSTGTLYVTQYNNEILLVAFISTMSTVAK